jgi:hypothetical protein
MTTILWKRVRAAARLFNRNPRYPWEDYLLHDVRWNGSDRNRLPALAFAVNAAWNAGVRNETLGQLCKHVGQKTTQLLVKGVKLQGLHLPDADPVEVGDVGEEMLRLILAGAGERKAVFAMKFIHWCQPCVLPPLDSEAWNAINDLTGDDQRWPGEGEWKADTCVQSWRRAVDFYADALSQLTDQSTRDLAEFDLNTQPAGYGRGNTLVRILDKFLWLHGKSLSARQARAKAAAAGAKGRP